MYIYVLYRCLVCVILVVTSVVCVNIGRLRALELLGHQVAECLSSVVFAGADRKAIHLQQQRTRELLERVAVSATVTLYTATHITATTYN